MLIPNYFLSLSAKWENFYFWSKCHFKFRLLSTQNYDIDKESSCVTEDEQMNLDKTSNK